MRPRKHIALSAGGFLAPAARRYRGNEQGLALVITLFVVALVTVLVLEYHFDAAVELDLAANYASDVQAYHLALAGVRFAQALLRRDINARSDGPESEWYKLGLVPACFAPQQLLDLVATGGGEGLAAVGSEAKGSALTDRQRGDASGGDVGCVSLRITDEDSKLPINALVPPPTTLGAPPPPPSPWVQIFREFFAHFFKTDPEVVDALIDWVTPDDRRSGGRTERSYYEQLPVPYKPPDGPMRTPGELRLVKGLDNPEELAKLFPGSTPEAVADLDLGSNVYLTTVWADASKDAKVNLNTATPEVLTALIAGLQPGNSTAARGIIEKRQEGQLTSLPNVGVPNLNTVAGVKSTYFRIESIGVVGIVHKKIVAVLKRQPPTVLPPTVPPLKMLYFKVE